jgi:hypothetical protein
VLWRTTRDSRHSSTRSGRIVLLLRMAVGATNIAHTPTTARRVGVHGVTHMASRHAAAKCRREWLLLRVLEVAS